VATGFVLAIDQGTSATKAVVVGPGGAAADVVQVPLSVASGPDGAVEVDAEALWASVVSAGSEAMRRAGAPRLDAVALANQGETIVPWEVFPSVLTPQLRAESLLVRLGDQRTPARRMAASTATPPSPHATRRLYVRQGDTVRGTLVLEGPLRGATHRLKGMLVRIPLGADACLEPGNGPVVVGPDG
jgi:sugar (pentulose or hexulose) kinase